MKYNFDEIIDRRHTNSLSFEGWKAYLFPDLNPKDFPFPEEYYIRLWVADMDFATPPEVLDAIRKRLDDKILGYTYLYDKDYFEVLRKWFAQRYQWHINPDDIVLSPGIVPALNRLVPLLTAPDESVLITTPSYAPFKKAGEYSARKVITSNLRHRNGKYEMNFDDIEQKLKDKSLGIKLFIHCHPHNPTGRVWTREELLKLGRLCLENDVWIISDEVHCDLLRKGQQHVPLATLFPDSDRIIVCTAPSKTFNLAGNMMSHLFIRHQGIRDEYKKLYREMLSPLSIAATKAAYENCEPWLEALTSYLDDNLTSLEGWLKDLLPEAGFRIPESTYLAWIDLSAYLKSIPSPDQPAVFFAREAGVLIEDENIFVDNSKGYIRVNVACPRSVLENGIGRMAEALLRFQ